ncbi:type I polyketide synthase [Azospirillum sp. Sh1]|uniref:type I polyketide synthase n=1 Tax=Azospirillum sp. Sh1 TaxID=2607285 RepID=UPI0011F01468|nr:type I polyketide synthase [Azospirillum sp. Sh1]KAA0578710.1 acyltransferase domain-containing protein [Azospirillum sp. Sh1]
MTAPVAVSGLAVLTADAPDLAAFWRNLTVGHDAVSLATAEDFGFDPATILAAGRGVVDRVCNLHGGWLRGFAPDLQGFRLPPEQLAGQGDLALWGLSLGRSALADAGFSPDAPPPRCGVVLGAYSWGAERFSTEQFQPLYDAVLTPKLAARLGDPGFVLPPVPPAGGVPEAARAAGGVPGLIGRALGLDGPRYAIDAACATSLYGLGLAALHLAAGDADTMLFVAVSNLSPAFACQGFSAVQALPEGGRSRPLDAGSDGIAVGQGGCAFLLRRLDAARRDGGRVRAVIRGVGLSSDGRGQHIVTPNPKGQMLACRRAYDAARLTPADIDVVECHATGTRVGDRSEAEVIAKLFGGDGALPPVGTVKSNVGHLLTAAGGVGTAKMLLSMEAGVLPATIGVETPMSVDGVTLPVVRKARPWPDRPARPRRAAVNAFGFGGTNGHLILEQATETDAVADAPADVPAAEVPLAVVGMDGAYGSAGSIAALRRRTPGGVPDMRPLAGGSRWRGLDADAAALAALGLTPDTLPRGAWMDDIALDGLRYRLPPGELQVLNPQQLLIMKVIDAALRRSGIAEGSRTAVIVAMECEHAVNRLQARWDLERRVRDGIARGGLSLSAEEVDRLVAETRDSLHAPCDQAVVLGYTGNLTASRITALWDFNGPNFSLSSEENGAFQALALAGLLLRSGEADAVVVGAVDLVGSPEAVMLRGRQVGGPGAAWLPGEGAGALVLKRLDEATAAGDRIHARIEAVGRASALSRDADGMRAAAAMAARAAFARAGVTPAEVGFVEMAAQGEAGADAAEELALVDVYGGAGAEGVAVPPVLGSGKAQFGHAGAAAGMLGLLRAVLALGDRVLPAMPGWAGPPAGAAWPDGLFRVPPRPQPFLRPAGGPRRAAVHGLGLDGSASCVVLAEGEAAPPRLGTEEQPAHVFEIPFDLDGGVDAALDRFEADLAKALKADPEAPRALATLSADRLKAAGAVAAPLAVALVAATPEGLRQEIAKARNGVPKALATKGAAQGLWQTPAGSCFAARPVGDVPIAYVFSGIGGAAPGLGQELFSLVPEALQALDEAFPDVRGLLRGDLLFPAGLTPDAGRLAERAEEQLRGTLQDQLAIGVVMPEALVGALERRLGLRPAMAFGHSLGEIAMLFAAGAWGHGEGLLERVVGSDVIRNRLSGPCTLLDELWGARTGDGPAFTTRVLMCAESQVRAALDGQDRVWLSMVNGAGEVTIAGAPDACDAVIARIGCESFRRADDLVIHCGPAEAERDALAALLPGDPPKPPSWRLLFAAGEEDRAPEAGGRHLAGRVADGLVRGVDFPALVERAYKAGARVFVEIGPGAACSRWISASLQGRPAVVLSVSRRGVGDAAMLVRLAAALLTHRIPFDRERWAALAGGEPAEVRRLPITVSLGGPPIGPAAPIPAAIPVPAPAPIPTPKPAPRAAPQPEPQPEPVAAPAMATPAASLPALPGRALVEQAVRLAADAARGHAEFLRARGARLEALLGLTRGTAPAGERPPVHDEAAVLEFAEGSVARVLGPEFADVDGYRRRIRVPAPPFMALSRVTDIRFTPGELGPAFIRTEYDIPASGWGIVDGQIPYLALDAQGVLILLSRMGIDRLLKGERGYRWLDAVVTYLGDLPRAGDRVTYDIQIERFARNGDQLLFFTTFLCSSGGRPVLRIDDCCAGFFTEAELVSGKGITDAHRVRRQPPAVAPAPVRAAVSTLGPRELGLLHRGELEAVFGASFATPGRNPDLRLPPEEVHMIDRVVQLDAQGGDLGLGLLVAEKDLDPEHWYIRTHFVDDPVFAGPCMIEGALQALKVFMLAAGLHRGCQAGRFQPVVGQPVRIKFRSQIPGVRSVFTYRMEIVHREDGPSPCAVADVDLIHDGRVAGRLEGLGLRIVDAAGSPVPSASVSSREGVPA